MDIKKIIMDASSFDECRLVDGDYLVQVMTQPVCKQLEDQPSEAVSKAYWSEVRNSRGITFLGDEDNQGLV
jgi:hypothetical protein